MLVCYARVLLCQCATAAPVLTSRGCWHQVPDKTPRDIEVTLSEGRYFNAWKATVLYAKQCKLHQVQELRSRQLPAHAPSSSRQLRPAAARRPWPEMMLKEIGKRNGEEREKVLQYVWGSLSSAAKTAGFTPIWMREFSYFHRYATLPPSPDQDLSPRDQHVASPLLSSAFAMPCPGLV